MFEEIKEKKVLMTHVVFKSDFFTASWASWRRLETEQSLLHSPRFIGQWRAAVHSSVELNTAVHCSQIWTVAPWSDWVQKVFFICYRYRLAH